MVNNGTTSSLLQGSHYSNYPYITSSEIWHSLPKIGSGRGLANLEFKHELEVKNLQKYFKTKFFAHSSRSTILPLSLHAAEVVTKENINIKFSIYTLTSGYMFPETKGSLFTIQIKFYRTECKSKSKKAANLDKKV